MIKMTPGRTVLIQADEPCRIEVLAPTDQTGACIYIYKGTEIDKEQEPVAVYDSVGMDQYDNQPIVVQ